MWKTKSKSWHDNDYLLQCQHCHFLLLCSSPLTKVKLINELNEREHQLGVKESVSWHTEYKDSAWVFVGKLYEIIIFLWVKCTYCYVLATLSWSSLQYNDALLMYFSVFQAGFHTNWQRETSSVYFLSKYRGRTTDERTDKNSWWVYNCALESIARNEPREDG